MFSIQLHLNRGKHNKLQNVMKEDIPSNDVINRCAVDELTDLVKQLRFFYLIICLY